MIKSGIKQGTKVGQRGKPGWDEQGRKVNEGRV